MKQGACYVRVSTDDQAELSPSTQIKAIRQYAREHDILLSDPFIFIDEGISGRKTKNRPAFQQMIGIAKTKPKPFAVILLWKFSRFARNQEEAIVYKSLLRKECGIEVISITEPIEDNPFGSLIERIIEWFDAYYSIRLGEDVKRSMTEKARRGEFQTGAPYGYVKKKDRPLTICPSEAEWIRYMFERFADNESYCKIAKELNAKGVKTKKGHAFESRTVEYIMNNPVYIGMLRWTPTGQTVGKRIYDSPDTITARGDHRPIITQDLWDRCQERIRLRNVNQKKQERPAEAKKHWITGLLTCGSCGKSLSYQRSGNGFQCTGYSHRLCPISHFIGLSKLESNLYHALEGLEVNKEYVKTVKPAASKDDELRDINREITRLKVMLRRAKTAYMEGLDSIEEYSAGKQKIGAAIDACQQQKTRLTQPAKADVPAVQKRPGSVASLLADTSIEQDDKYNAIRAIIEKIVFKRPEEELSIYFFKKV